MKGNYHSRQSFFMSSTLWHSSYHRLTNCDRTLDTVAVLVCWFAKTCWMNRVTRSVIKKVVQPSEDNGNEESEVRVLTVFDRWWATFGSPPSRWQLCGIYCLKFGLIIHTSWNVVVAAHSSNHQAATVVDFFFTFVSSMNEGSSSSSSMF